MKRALPTLGLTAAGLATILGFNTRAATSIELSGVATVAPQVGAVGATNQSDSVTASNGSTDDSSTTDASGGQAQNLDQTRNQSSVDPGTAERQQIMSLLPDWVIGRIDEQFPDGIPLNLLEQVAFELGIQFDQSGNGGSGTDSAASGSAGESAAPTTSLSPTAQVVDGPTANTPWGPYQVEVTIDGGAIVDAKFIRTPRDMQSMAIQRYAIPRLTEQTLANQSGEVQFISGATYTSWSYQQSLQAALDAAGF